MPKRLKKTNADLVTKRKFRVLKIYHRTKSWNLNSREEQIGWYQDLNKRTFNLQNCERIMEEVG